MIARSIPHNLLVAVHQLVANLDSPIEPGELVAWLGSVHEALQAVTELLLQKQHDVDRVKYARTVRVDQKLVSEAERVRGGDTKCLLHGEQFFAQATRLLRRALDSGPDQLSLKDDVQALIERGFAFALFVQRQEFAHRTWLQNASQRDRGVAD